MYNVCTMYTTAVGVISPRQLACCLHRNEYDIWCNVCWETFCSLRSHGTRDKAGSIIDKGHRERWFVDVLSASCSRETVSGEMFAGKRSVRFAHTAHASLMGAYAPKRSANRALSREGRAFALATNGTIERFGNLVRQELMNVWRDSILFASLTRHTIVANATIKTVPCHGKSGCLRLRSN